MADFDILFLGVFISFLLGVIFPLYTLRKRYLWWVLLIWILIAVVDVMYSYYSWTPPPANAPKVFLYSKSGIENALWGFVGFLIISFYAGMLYGTGFVVRLLVDIFRKKRKKK